MKKIVFGLILSIFFVYFTLRGLDIDKVKNGLKHLQYIYLLPTILYCIFGYMLRSIRWGVILSPLKKIEQKKLFPIVLVGFMYIVLIPMRVGEIVRPYLISSKKLIPFSSSLASVVVERILDTFCILVITLIVLYNSTLPPWLMKSFHSIGIFLILFCFFLVILYFKTDSVLSFLSPIMKRLPSRVCEIITGLAKDFIRGFDFIGNPWKLFITICLSFLIWGCSGLMIFNLFKFQGLQLSGLAAFTVLIINIIGISLPTAPGMLGNFQFACIIALSLFNISKDEAFIFSMIYYFASIGITIFLGLLALPYVDFSFTKLQNEIRKRIIG